MISIVSYYIVRRINSHSRTSQSELSLIVLKTIHMSITQKYNQWCRLTQYNDEGQLRLK